MKKTLVIHKKASDNKYMHKDFHGALSCALTYLNKNYGEKAIFNYLKDFTRNYYAPLRKKIRKNGLHALIKYFRNIYKEEGGIANFEVTEDKLIITVKKCPAICHMKARGYPISPLFCETTRIMNEQICRGTPLKAVLSDFSMTKGKCTQIFLRRKP